MIKKISLSLLLSVCITLLTAQTLQEYVHCFSTDSLIDLIVEQQSTGTDYFDEGMFPSYRQHTMSNKFWKDENLFFSQIILFTLGNYIEYFDERQDSLYNSMRIKMIKNYPKFKNPDGRNTYNFWKTNPSDHFPNSPFFSKHRKFKIPDDMDDTSIAFMILDADSIALQELKQEMIKHTNQYKLQVKNIFKRYRNYQAYSTWFGENMPIEFDICVLANILYMVHYFDLELNHYDRESLDMLEAMIKSGDHLKYSEYLSPNYKSNTLVLYHLGRFIADCKPAQLMPCIPQLKAEIKQEMKKNKSFMELVLLSSTLMKLGEQPEEYILHKRIDYNEEFYPFYVANMASMMTDPLKRWFAKTDLFSINYVCPAYNYVMILENKMLRLKFE